MATIKEPKATNNLHSAIALLDAAAFCDDLSMVVDTIKVIIKRDFKKSTTTTREINSMLNLLSNVIPLISESVKSKASKCAPTKSNASYVRSRLQSQSNPLGMSGIERLKQLLKESSCVSSSPELRVQQKRKNAPTAMVSPHKSNPLPPDCPVPHNDKFFLIEEAVLAYQQYPHRNKRTKLLTYWQEQHWVPAYGNGRRTWNKMIQRIKDGKSLREWQLDKKGNFLLEKRGGSPSIVSYKQAESFFNEKISMGQNVNNSHVEELIASAAKENDEAKGLYHNSTSVLCSNKTMINYKSVLAEMGESITTKSVSKTEVRQIAETSIRSTISFMMMTAVTFFQIGQLQPGRPSLKDATEGAKDFEKLVSLANNNVDQEMLNGKEKNLRQQA